MTGAAPKTNHQVRAQWAGEGPGVLAINTGSSSVKASIFSTAKGGRLVRQASIEIDRIGKPRSRRVVELPGHDTTEQIADMPDHATALATLHSWLDEGNHTGSIAAIGHRVVHGGSAFREPTEISTAMLDTLDEWVPIDPEHLPQAIAAMRELTAWLPHVPQIACFDTAFHRTMPRVAQIFPLPKRFANDGVIRFGFHGLSCESIMHQLKTLLEVNVPPRIVIAHLGNGSSMTAVLNGDSIETTMGFSPTGGIMMGTRTGDLDPGALLHLISTQDLSPAAASTLLNKESGLLGVSGGSNDMRDLLERRASDPDSAEAVALYCYMAKKAIGALAAVLGGLDLLVFTGGIGENAAPVREEICTGLEFLGIALDPARNRQSLHVVSGVNSPVTVRVMQTDEETIIARQASQHLAAKGGADV